MLKVLRGSGIWHFRCYNVLTLLHWIQAVGKALFRAHVEGQLKVFITLYTFVFWVSSFTQVSSNQRIHIQSEIMSKPELFVEPDPELPLALLDQKEVLFIPFCKCWSDALFLLNDGFLYCPHILCICEYCFLAD